MRFIINIYSNEKAAIKAGPYFIDHFSKDRFNENNIKVSHYIIPTNGYQRMVLVSPNGDTRELKPSAIKELTELMNTLSGINN